MRVLFVLMLVLSNSVSASYYGNYFTLDKVGGSLNTSSVFAYVLEPADGSTCENKKHFKMPDDHKHSDRFLSVMLAAQAQGKQVYIGYDHEDCYVDGAVPRVYYIKN